MTDRFNLSLRYKLAAGFATALLVLAVGAISFWAVMRAAKASTAVAHTSEVLLEEQKLLAALADAETATRGYTVTGDGSFLVPLESARVRLPASLARLRALTADNPVQQTRLDTLESVARESMKLNEQIARFRREDGFGLARDLIATGQGKMVMDHARALTATVGAEERRNLAGRTALQTQSERVAYLATGIGGGLAFLLSLFINRSIRRDVLEREEQRTMIEKQSRQLQRQAAKLESQQAALEQQLAEQQALTSELSQSNDNLQAANVATTSQKARAEEALQRTQEAQRERLRLGRQISAMLESTAAGFYGIDANGLCTFINPAGAGMLGFTVDELLGREMHETVHHHRRDGSRYPLEECPIYRSFQSGVSSESESEVFWKKDGKPMFVEYSTSPIVDEVGIGGAVVAFADITTRRMAQAEREQLINALARSNQELDQFAYVASHDLKAPLRGIANLSQWIEEDLGKRLGGENKSQMGLLRGRVQRMEALIDGILQYSRAGRARAKPEPVDSGVLVAEVIELIAPPRATRFDVMQGMPEVNAEKIPLQQVFMNLIGNAVKHAGSADPLVSVAWKDAEPFVEFSVSDNGNGIAPQYHDRIFGIFQTLEARDKVEGTGIGLSVVKKIVEAKGGRVWVESDVGEGATFRFLWPKSEITAE